MPHTQAVLPEFSLAGPAYSYTKDTESEEYMFPGAGRMKEEAETGLRIQLCHLPVSPSDEALERRTGW